MRIKQAVEALVQLAKVRTEQLRYEAAKANKYPVRITQEPMKLLNQAGVYQVPPHSFSLPE